MADSPLVASLKQVHIVQATGGGTKEESYSPALAALLNGVGDWLKPRVHCVTELGSLRAGHPDIGLFTDNREDPDGSNLFTWHSTARQAATVARDAGARRLLLTQFSARYAGTAQLVAEAREVFPETEAAEELRRYDVRR